MTKKDIIKEITDYVNQNFPAGATTKSFYVGIATDAENRLFIDHAVDKDNDIWIYCPTDSEQDARDIEKYFLDLELDGGSGGGKDIQYVYCFLQNSHTKR